AELAQDRHLAARRLVEYYAHTAHVAGRQVPRRPPADDLTPDGNPPTWAPTLTSRQEAAAWLESERHNLHACVGYAATHGMPQHASCIAAAIHGFLREHSYWDQALSVHQTAVEAARQAHDRNAEAHALADLADTQYTAMSYSAASENFTSALGLYQDL